MRLRISILALVILIAACSSKPDSPDSASGAINYVRSGTSGINMEFVSNMPPAKVFDTTGITALIELKNQGAHDIPYSECFITLSNFDPNIIYGVNQRQPCGELIGKSPFNIDGGLNVMEFKSNNIRLPAEVLSYSPDLVASACYQYKTVATPEVCVDPNFYDIASEVKSCEVRDIAMGGGQGAPIAVNYVNVDMAGSKAVFEIDVQNSGGGRVISPRASIANCPVGFQYSDYDELRYRVELTGGRLLRCSPSNWMLRLSSNKGKIVCSFDIGNKPSMVSILKVELDYNYLNSIKKGIQILREP